MKHLAAIFALVAGPAAATTDIYAIDQCLYRRTDAGYLVLIDPTCGSRDEGEQAKPDKPKDPPKDKPKDCKPHKDRGHKGRGGKGHG